MAEDFNSFISDGPAPGQVQMFKLFAVLGNELEGVVCEGKTLFHVEILQVRKSPDNLPNVGIIESDELGKFESLEGVDFRTDECDSFVVEFFAAGKENSSDGGFGITEQNGDFLVGY